VKVDWTVGTIVGVYVGVPGEGVAVEVSVADGRSGVEVNEYVMVGVSVNVPGDETAVEASVCVGVGTWVGVLVGRGSGTGVGDVWPQPENTRRNSVNERPKMTTADIWKRIRSPLIITMTISLFDL